MKNLFNWKKGIGFFVVIMLTFFVSCKKETITELEKNETTQTIANQESKQDDFAVENSERNIEVKVDSIVNDSVKIVSEVTKTDGETEKNETIQVEVINEEQPTIAETEQVKPEEVKTPVEKVEQKMTQADFYKLLDVFFAKYVRNGKVNYAAIKSNKKQLNEILKAAEKFVPSTSNKNDYQAFWINMYNIFTIKGVVDAYPISSPMDVSGFFDQKKHRLGGESFTLNNIENKKLRAKYPKEARVHFVLVCAAASCPPIISKAYKPAQLNSMLNTQTKKAMNNSNFIKVDDAKKEVSISKIFEWYKVDFDKNNGTLNYINKFRTNKIPSDYKITYYEYDWKLNKQ